jgi:hypothetical protein
LILSLFADIFVISSFSMIFTLSLSMFLSSRLAAPLRVASQLCRATAGGAAAMPAVLLLTEATVSAVPLALAPHPCRATHRGTAPLLATPLAVAPQAWRSQQAQKLSKIPAQDQIHNYIGIQTHIGKHAQAQAHKCSQIHILANMLKIKLKLTNTRSYITNTFKFKHQIMH